ncbi:NADH dehydrogenase [ubiquinone] flavoprotein 3, mitochondrial isoform X2 [Tenrec ecaudatus]
MVADPDPDDLVLATHEGAPRALARKTLVDFPQQASSSFRKQGSDLDRHWGSTEVGQDSSSSSSSPSDSDSEEEERVSEVGPRAGSKGRGSFSASEASFNGRTPRVMTAAKEKSWSPTPTDSKTPYQATMKTRPQAEMNEGVQKQRVKEEQPQSVFGANDIDRESQAAAELKQDLPDRTGSRVATQLSPGPPRMAEDTGAEKQPQAALSEARGKSVEKQVPGPKWKVAFPQLEKENVEKPVGDLQAAAQTNEGDLEHRGAIGSLKTVPAPDEDAFDDKIAVLNSEAPSERLQDSTTQSADPDRIQEAEPAAAPAKPFDNTTYKNLQHHDYNEYTFLDLNLDLSKFRMPQPSSGRESPRH